MSDDRIASLLLMLAPLWPVVAAGVLGFPRRARSDEDALGVDRECRSVAALAAALSCGSLLAAMLLASGEIRAPVPDPRSVWFVIPAASDIFVTFRLRMDILSGPAAIAVTLLGCAAVLSQRRTVTTINPPPPYGRWMLLLSAAQVLLLANDLVLLVAAIIVSELLCRSLIPKPLSGVRALTLLPFLWIALQWQVGFTRYSVDAMAAAELWSRMGGQQPMFALVSGLCLLTFVLGRAELYPFSVDVDRVYDDTPGRLFWFGCLGSWLPAQYLLLRFWPVLGASTLGVPGLASLGVLLTILSAWMALARPHRAGSLAMIGAGMLALTWTALGSGHSSGFWVAASASLSLLLLFGGLVILADASDWLSDPFTPRRVPGRRTLWVAIILLSSGIGVQQAWEVTFEMSRQVDSPDISTVAESVDGELIEIPAPKVHALLPMVMALAHGLLWFAAGFVLSPILLGLTPRRTAVIDEQAEVADIILPASRAVPTVDQPVEAATAEPSPVTAPAAVPQPAAASTWLARRLCGGLVLCAVLWGPAWGELLRSRGDGMTAEFVMWLTAAPWGVMLSAGLLGMAAGCWIALAMSHRPSSANEPWRKLADAGRRLFYLPEIGRSLMLPVRQLLELPVLLESMRIPTAEILSEETMASDAMEQELPASVAAAWLLPLAGLWSVAAIWTLLLIW